MKVSNNVLSNLIDNIKQFPLEGNKLLKNPLIESFIITKWQKVKKFFNIQYILTFIFVLGLSILSTLKCGTFDVNETILFGMLVPIYIEMILFEIFLFSKKQTAYHYIQSSLKLLAFVLAAVNLCSFSNCDGIFRHVS